MTDSIITHYLSLFTTFYYLCFVENINFAKTLEINC